MWFETSQCINDLCCGLGGGGFAVRGRDMERVEDIIKLNWKIKKIFFLC